MQLRFEGKFFLSNSLTSECLIPILRRMSGIDQSTKLFNTAVIATKIPKLSNYSSKLSELVQSVAFQAILRAIQDYAQKQGISEEQAAEEIVQTFRDIDMVWDDYIFQEGLDKLKGHLST